ncbi:hypothetical protein QQG55_50605 [Brugia pahangi]
MKSTVSANETGIEGRIQEEKREYKKLWRKGETTYMEASVSPSAGTGLPGLGLSMTPFSIPESSVSMKSTVSANETGIEGRIQEEEERRNTKIGRKRRNDIYGSFSITISWHWAAWSWSIDDTLLYT